MRFDEIEEKPEKFLSEGDETQEFVIPEELLRNSLLLFEDGESSGAICPEETSEELSGEAEIKSSVDKVQPGEFRLELEPTREETHFQKVKKEISEYMSMRQEYTDVLKHRALNRREDKKVYPEKNQDTSNTITFCSIPVYKRDRITLNGNYTAQDEGGKPDGEKRVDKHNKKTKVKLKPTARERPDSLKDKNPQPDIKCREHRLENDSNYARLNKLAARVKQEKLVPEHKPDLNESRDDYKNSSKLQSKRDTEDISAAKECFSLHALTNPKRSSAEKAGFEMALGNMAGICLKDKKKAFDIWDKKTGRDNRKI
jgi:uncharacterized protein YnzC (UPF0291/DUF896 family)